MEDDLKKALENDFGAALKKGTAGKPFRVEDGPEPIPKRYFEIKTEPKELRGTPAKPQYDLYSAEEVSQLLQQNTEKYRCSCRYVYIGREFEVVNYLFARKRVIFLSLREEKIIYSGYESLPRWSNTKVILSYDGISEFLGWVDDPDPKINLI